MVCTHPSPSSIRSHHAASPNRRIKPWRKACKVFVVLAFIFLGALTAHGQDQAKMDEFNKKIEALAGEMAACGPDINCIQRVTREMQKLGAEMQRMSERAASGQGQPPAPAPGSSPGVPAGAVPGSHGPMTRVPVSIKVVNFTEMKHMSRGDNGQAYIAEYYIFEYEAEEEGFLDYAKDFERFSLKAPNVSPWTTEKPKNFRIKRASGYTQGTAMEHSTGRRILRRYANGPVTGLDSMHKNFVFRVLHPALEDSPFNVNFQPVYVSATMRSGKDVYPITYEPTYLDAYATEVPNPDDFMLTPVMIKEGLEKGRLQKVFKWQEKIDDLGGDKKNILTVTISFRANPGILSVSPKKGFQSSGPDESGRFSPPSRAYTLKNTGGSPIEFKVDKGKSWLELSHSGGDLEPGESTQVTVSIKGSAQNLENGTYKDNVSFVNLANGRGNTTRPVQLTVGEKQHWQITIKGYDVDDSQAPSFFKGTDGTQKTLHKKVRFNWSLKAQFILEKKKKLWMFKTGTIKTAKLNPVPSFLPPDIYTCKIVKCPPPGQFPISSMIGRQITGHVYEHKVKLMWPPLQPRVCVNCVTKHSGFPKMPFESQYVSGDFTTQIGMESYPLKDGWSKSYDKIHKKNHWLSFKVTMKRLK